MSEPRRLRWWPALAVLALFFGFLVFTWAFKDLNRQNNVMETMAASALALVLLLVWFLVASRAPWQWRLGALAAVGVSAVVASQFLTITGVSGDLVPIIGWKGAPEARAAEVAIQASGPLAESPREDYPQFLGPQRNASVSGVRLARDWQASPPRQIWRREVGAAWSGFSIQGDWAVTQEQHEDQEQVVAYDLATGEVRWRHADAVRYETTIGGVGPRATPTIEGDRVYTLGATGILNALDLETGKKLWAVDILAQHGAANREWGKSCSPLVVDDLVVVSAGGVADASLVAYDRETGRLAWSAGNDTSSYSSPVLATLAGREQILIRNQNSITAHDPETGTVLWSAEWPGGQPNVAVPLVLEGDRVLLSSGYGIGSKLYRIEERNGALEATVLWTSPRLKAKFTNVVEHDGAVYGLDDGVMVCLDPETGERCWKKGRYGHGQMILSGDLLVVSTEKGEVVLIAPNPEKLDELATLEVFEGKTWNPAALAGSLLLLRTDREAALYELPVAG